MPIYKKGDRVVVIRSDNVYRIGQAATIADTTYIPGLLFDNGSYGAELQRDLVLEEIYNTPLYRALQEE